MILPAREQNDRSESISRGMLHLSQAVTSSEMGKNSGTSPVIMMQATQNGEREDLAICVICWHWPSLRFWKRHA